jgi:hypothetical protein
MRTHRLFQLARRLLCLALLLPSLATAWVSGTEKPYGPFQAVRNPPWRWDPNEAVPNEHARLLVLALQRAGVPVEGTFNASVYTDKSIVVDPLAPGQRSAFPTPLAAPGTNFRNTRYYDIAGFASLPDHSYSMGDWAAGNEVCPRGTMPNSVPASAVDCHDFEFHLGMLNSTHFPPQSMKIYQDYHTIALQRAGECTVLGQAVLGIAAQNQLARDAATECEREALLLEATGQHFLQDAWAVGHMWERWGYSSFNLFPGAPAPIGYERSVLTSMVSGLFHGAESVLHVPDEMSAGDDPKVAWWNPTSSDPLSQPGIGDLYLDKLLGDPQYVRQRESLLNCSASGLREVYARTSQVSGALRAFGGQQVDSTGPACWAQRVTNQALLQGFGVRCPPSTIGKLGDACAALDLVVQGPWFWAHTVPWLKSVSSQAQQEYESSMLLLSNIVRMFGTNDPYSLSLASGGLSGTFMSVDKNSAAAAASVPTSYADPPLPWAPKLATASIASDWDPGTYLSRVFHLSHAREMCTADEASLPALKDKLDTVSDADYAVACEMCIEFTSRQVFADGPSLCTLAGAATEPLLAQPGDSIRVTARSQCGCGHWDVAIDFRNRNPSDDWRYGWIPMNDLGGPQAFYALTPFGPAGRYSGIDFFWDAAITQTGIPNVTHNSLAQTVSVVVGLPFDPVQIGIANPPKAFTFHPGPSTLGVARWTAPRDGRYVIHASFTPINPDWSGMDVFVLRSSGDFQPITPLFAQRLLAVSTQLLPTYDSGPLDLKKGDQIDFAIGPGPRADPTNDTVVLDATIDLLQDPPTRQARRRPQAVALPLGAAP